MSLTPLTMLLSWVAYLYSLQFTVLHLGLIGSNHTFQIVYSASSVHMISLNPTKVALAYYKAQHLTHSVYTLYHSSQFTYFLVVTQCRSSQKLKQFARTVCRFWLQKRSKFETVGLNWHPDSWPVCFMVGAKQHWKPWPDASAGGHWTRFNQTSPDSRD